MDKKRKLVFATNNAHKLEEARRIIHGDFEIVSLAEIGCHDDIPETADTLEGNALIKARWVRDRYGCDCFADDTGLMVDALGGAPGVYSARYAGPHCTPADNVRKLLAEMEGVDNRAARFSTVVALAADGEEHCFEGSVEGTIATEPHGNGGFGYDPVFVANESGKCFAEMSADHKNAISHRGRAMRKLRDFLAMMTVMAVLMICGGMKAVASEWRVHHSYDGQMERVIDTPNYTYFLGASQKYNPAAASTSTLYGKLMRYDKKGEEFQILGSRNGISGDIISAIEYNRIKKCLAIAYNDGNIDILYDNGDLYNIPGLKMNNNYLKRVHSISVSADGSLFYLCTDFGIAVVNEANKEMGNSFIWNMPVKAVAQVGDKLWVATADKILSATVGSRLLSDYEELTPLDNAVRMFALGSRGVVVLYGLNRNNMHGATILREGDSYVQTHYDTSSWQGLEPYEGGYLMSGSGMALFLFHHDGTYTRMTLPQSDAGALVGSYDGKEFWTSNQRKGVSRKRWDSRNNNWSVLMDYFFPNVSNAFLCSAMQYSPEYGLLVRNHGLDQNFGDKMLFDAPDLISSYRGLEWSPVSATYKANKPGLGFLTPHGIAIDPNNPNHVYSGSVFTGVLRLDLENQENSIHMSKPSDVTGGNGKPGFAVIVEDPPTTSAWERKCLFSAPGFDNYGNLWILYDRQQPNKEDSKTTELWYWTAEDRAATTSYLNVRPWGKIVVNEPMSNSPCMLVLKNHANRNLIVVAGNTFGGNIFVYDHNGTPDDTSDDRMVKLENLHDQDGLEVKLIYAFSFYEDPQTGLVWVSSSEALFTFDPKTIFENPTSVRRIKVARNDGTNLADYLLNGVKVSQIINDEQGHKWFATAGAGLMCTSADGREILRTYTTENSDILGDELYSLCINPENNSIMVSTDNGLCELFLKGSGPGAGSDVKVYPNPVRPDFHGIVTIEGLPERAMVKVIDMNGALVKECGQAQDGKMEWNLTNNAMRRVPAGPYFILCTNGKDADSFSHVGKVMVIE